MSSVVDQGAVAGRGQGERFVSEFAARLERGQATGPAWLNELRSAAMAWFRTSGFPTTRQEDWRFTPIGPIASTAFVPAERLHVHPQQLAPYTFEEAAAELVFVNGIYAPELSRCPDTLTGVTVGNLADLLQRGGSALSGRLAGLASPTATAFTALNTSLFADGAYVEIAREAVVPQPIHVLFFSTVSGAPHASHPRLLFVAGEHSESRLIETYAGLAPQVYLTNAVSEYLIGDRAIVDHYKVQRESTAAYHMATLQVRTGHQTNFVSHALTMGGAIARNDIAAVLGGEGGDTTLNGLYIGDGQQLLDTHTTIDHALPHNGSHELYKGILGGRSRAVFNGKIIVRPDAQKTDAKQTNKALLLSEQAEINTKPQLEIFADDVKCTHGATIGQLDEEMVFYLRARGLGRHEARALLIQGFAGDITNRIRFEPLRARLDAALMSLLPKDSVEPSSRDRR
jgi:Fe-S cluster assembly protein SufD